MEDLKTLTVRTLRELARKHLGKGHSKLKTKEELMAALKNIAAAAQVPAEVVKFAKQALAPKRAAPATAPRQVAAAPRAAAEPRPAEPLIEGFFVARVVGEGEARRHGLVEDRAPVEVQRPAGYDEKLGDLPWSYGDDAAVLLPRDPGTLFYFWDFRDDTRAEALAGLDRPRAVLRVYEGSQLLREVDFALESRSFYLHDLTPGRAYRVEVHFVGSDGRSKRVGRSSNVATLPPSGPSSNTTVRYLRVPWDAPLKQLRQWLKEGRARLDERRGRFDYLPAAGFQAGSSASFPSGPQRAQSSEGPHHPVPSSSQRTWSSWASGRH